MMPATPLPALLQGTRVRPRPFAAADITEAWRLFTDGLLGTPGLRKVTAGTLACYRTMLDVAERSGMQREGVRRAQELVDGVPTDIVCFARCAPMAAAAAAPWALAAGAQQMAESDHASA